MNKIDMRGENPLRAVIAGRESNAYVVGLNALAHGVNHTMEHYKLDYDTVLDAVKFYLDNREAIDRLLDEVSEHAMSIDEFKAHVAERRKKVSS